MSQNTKILSVIAVLIIAAAVYFLSDSRVADAPTKPVNGTTSTATSTKEFSLEIVDKKVQGNSTLRVNQGDTIVVKITANEAEEFHVHAYDDSVELEPGVEATLSFVADASGRFPFELEKSGTEIGAIEVLP